MEPPFVCLIASGGPHAAGPRRATTTASRCSAARSTTPPARPSTRARGCSGCRFPAVPRSSGSPATATRAAFSFPVARNLAGLDFSFAGVKTSLLYKVRELGEQAARERAADLAASYQAAIVEALAARCEQALAQTGIDRLAVGGGVAANGPLRARLAALGATVGIPPRELCTDNAAMIASAARFVPAQPFPDYLALDAYASGERALA